MSKRAFSSKLPRIVATTQLPFDEVVVDRTEARVRYDAMEFLALPLHEQVGHILAGRARFFCQGDAVRADLALRVFRERAARA